MSTGSRSVLYRLSEQSCHGSRFSESSPHRQPKIPCVENSQAASSVLLSRSGATWALFGTACNSQRGRVHEHFQLVLVIADH